MIKLKDILLEILNNFSVEADVFIDPKVNIYDVTNELRALIVMMHSDNLIFDKNSNRISKLK